MSTEKKYPQRSEYLAHEVTHEDYYGSVANALGVTIKHDDPLLAKVRSSLKRTGKNLNTIPLEVWDRLGGANGGIVKQYSLGCWKAFEKHGDFPSAAGMVCAYKEAYRRAARKSSAGSIQAAKGEQ